MWLLRRQDVFDGDQEVEIRFYDPNDLKMKMHNCAFEKQKDLFTWTQKSGI